MNHRWKVITFLLVALCTTVLLTGQTQSPKKPQVEEEPDLSGFPIVDLKKAKAAKNEKKGKKYNNRYAAPISEVSNGMFFMVDWYREPFSTAGILKLLRNHC